MSAGRIPLAAAAVYAFDHFGEYWKQRGERAQARTWFERSKQAWTARPEQTPGVRQQRKLAEERVRAIEP